MRTIKKSVFIFILFVIMVVSAACSKEEVIKIDPIDHYCVVTELINKDIEDKYNKAVEKPILFTNYNDYEKFAKQYFKSYTSKKDFDFEKYDYLFINGKKINSKKHIFSRLDSIIRKNNKVQFIIKEGLKGETAEPIGDTDTVIEAFSYAFISKEIIHSNDEIQFVKE